MKKIKEIKKGILRRNASLLKYALKTGVSVIQNRDDPKKMLESIIGVNPQKFVDELSLYKGSITKAGQILSQYGEYYLSPSINEKLRLLQGSTHYLDFEKISDQLEPSVHDEFNIEERPIAAASIGQVHLARRLSNDKKYVFKIQYHGIGRAITGDLSFIKLFTSSLKVIPKGVDASDVFLEIEKVLRQEMNYVREADVLRRYREKLDDNYFYVPKVLKKYSNKKTICLEYIEGRPLSELEKIPVVQEKIDLLGNKIFELFLREIFEFYLVQTDAHGGNYFVNDDLDKLYLLDFGACLEFDKDLLRYYQNFLRYSFFEDREGFLNEFDKFIAYTGKDLEYEQDLMWEYMLLASSPLRSESFDWGETKLPDELFTLGKELQKKLKFNSIPSDFIFLDRKVMGVFSLLRKTRAKFNVKQTFENIAL